MKIDSSKLPLYSQYKSIKFGTKLKSTERDQYGKVQRERITDNDREKEGGEIIFCYLAVVCIFLAHHRTCQEFAKKRYFHLQYGVPISAIIPVKR